MLKNNKILFLMIFSFSILIILLEYSKIKIFLIKNIFTNLLYYISLKSDLYFHNKFIKNNLKKKSNILIFGCGLNTYYNILKNEGHNVISLDIEDQSIVSDKIILYDGINIPKFSIKFDYVIINTVLHHINSNSILYLLNSS